MTYFSFLDTAPILYGTIIVNGKCKIGQFKPEWNYLTNSLVYRYYTHKDNKGTGGFSTKKAFALFTAGCLSTNPQDGDPANYISITV
jgi:hypothetical protein